MEAAARERGAHLWWLGQSGFLLQAEERHLLFDPYLSDSLTRKYEGTDRPHVRMTARVVDPARLAFVDVVTSSHAHTDHLDPETLSALVSGGATLVCPQAIVATALERSGVEPVGLRDGESVHLAGFRVEAVPAAHPDPGPAYAGFLVIARGRVVYHAGDTLAFSRLVARLAPRGVDVALLPINGRLGNMDAVAAASLAHATGAGLAVPCHYDMFEFNTASPHAFAVACDRLGQPYRILRAGERLTLRATRRAASRA